ncbi:hypothetical protein AHAS_Ahas15G0146700 [Arachis hypogaea]
MQEGQLTKNKETWKLAVKSGAVFYDEEEDIREVLQSQNETIVVKQKEKIKRSRPKQHNKVCKNSFK